MRSLYTILYAVPRLASGKPYGIESTHKLAEGVELALGSREIEVDHQLSREDFLSGRCFGRGGLPDTSASASRPSAAKQFVPLRPKTLNGGKISAYIVPSAVVEKEKRGVDLESVDLVVSQKSAQKPSARESFWIANWWVMWPLAHWCVADRTVRACACRRKPQQKKHKTWDGDGFVVHAGEKLTLLSDGGLV